MKREGKWSSPLPDPDSFEAEFAVDVATYLRDYPTLGNNQFQQCLDENWLISQLSRDVPCFVLSEDNTVLEANHSAMNELKLVPGQVTAELHLADLGRGHSNKLVTIEIGTDQSPAFVPCRVSFTERQHNFDGIYLKVKRSDQDGVATIVICSVEEYATQVSQMADIFDLTKSEKEILQLFVNGKTVPEIADFRSRSIETVKTQFYALMNKCNCVNQVDLLRVVTSLTELKLQAEPVRTKLSKFRRGSYRIARPNHRVVDVTSFGCPTGRPIVLCGSFFLDGFRASIEELFFEEGVLVYVVWPPGCGETSPAPTDVSLSKCFADDIVALLDSIGVEKTVLWAPGTLFALGLDVVQHHPDRYKSIFCHILTSPNARLAKHSRGLGWASLLRKNISKRVTSFDTVLASLLFGYMRRVGVKRFLSQTYSHDPIGKEACLEPENLSCFESALARSGLQGDKGNTEILKQACFVEWESKLATTPVPVHFMIGETDSVSPHSLVEDLASDYPHTITLETVKAHGPAFFLIEPKRLICGLTRSFDKARFGD